jgi:uncharacterized protein (TIGR03118 family)
MKTIVASDGVKKVGQKEGHTIQLENARLTWKATVQHRRITAAIALSVAAVATAQQYKQTNLVSNSPGVAPVTDQLLVNPWGLSRGSGTAWWVADNAAGVATLYNGPGVKQSLVVTIPPADPANKKTPTGSPTGTVFNGSLTDFLLAPGKQAVFLFSTLDGSIAGWNPNVAIANGEKAPSTHAVTVAKTRDGSIYTGFTSGFVNGKRFLYAANFGKGRVDIFDSQFHRVMFNAGDYAQDQSGDDNDLNLTLNEPFQDTHIPQGYVPFNVQAIGDDIVVTYNPDNPLVSGPGKGYVDIFTSQGQLLRRLEHGNWLNGPWGVALAPLDFGRFSHDLLVAQFGGGDSTESAGLIVAFDLATGRFDGVLEDENRKPIVIPGIWAISPGNVTPSNSDPAASSAAQLYFTAGPDQGPSLFGYLTAVRTELTEGNAQ